uniref:Uncharacterized protein n=1 Tax=Ananas comosus var. bracteatus TaxID=296719 RepID=A0A6V7QK78_ANACO|nr:unnamed protein product [Ananas comosus var. bracteatus]
MEEGAKKEKAEEEEEEEEEEDLLFGLKISKAIITAVGQKGGLSTPAPAWKLEDEDEDELSPAAKPRRVRGSAVSARRLAASFWEMQNLQPSPSPRRPSYSAARPRSRPIDRPKNSDGLRRELAASLIHNHKLPERSSLTLQPLSPASCSSTMEPALFDQAITPSSSIDLKGKLVESGYRLKTSAELLKVLNRIWSLEEKHASDISLVKALKAELQHTQACTQELMREQHGYRHQVDSLMKQVSEDKQIRRSKELERVEEAAQSMQLELEDERRLRRRSESLHRKLGKELSEAKAAFQKATKELEKEREANCLLEDLCDEFAKGIRCYEEEVRELKHGPETNYSPKFDRMVLDISKAWLDARDRMEAAESKGDLAEMCKITEKLSGEIQTFLQAKSDDMHKNDRKRGSNLRRQSLESLYLNGNMSAPHDAEEDDSVASDLHCFELNMGALSHEQLNQHSKHGTEKLDSTRNCHFAERRMRYSENTKGESSCSMQFEADCPDNVTTRKSENSHSQKGGKGSSMEWDGMNVVNHLNDSLLKKHLEFSKCCKIQHDDSEREKPRNHLLRRGQFIKETGSGNLRNLSSPLHNASLDLEISERSSKLRRGMKETSLKTKLIEARLEGRHSRLKASKASSIDRTRE